MNNLLRAAPLSETSSLSAHSRWRLLKDTLARYGVAFGGIGVIIAILLIFFYLLYVVFPLFVPASMEPVSRYGLPGAEQGRTLHLDMEEQGELAVRYSEMGSALFFATRDGALRETVGLSGGVAVTAVGRGSPGSSKVALGLADGRAVFAQHRFRVSYPNDVRTISPVLEFPYGEEPLVIDPEGRAISALAVSDGEEALILAARVEGGGLLLVTYSKESSFLDETVTLERHDSELVGADIPVDYLLIEPNQEHLYLASREGDLLHFDIRNTEEPRLRERVRVVPKGTSLTALRFLTGGYSLLAGASDGSVSQWFPVRDENNEFALQRIRGFDSQSAPILAFAAEPRRKGFLAADESGTVGIYHSTAERTLLTEVVTDTAIGQLAISPRADFFLAEDRAGQVHFWRVENDHPEVSWSSLWGKVHYEGYSEADYTWQSSSASNDFEPKFSLAPLAFGTLKAAFYAMLFAVPIAILGAIYGAYFMAPRMRRVVKPTIEIMEALPTVILGFLAGLWLAPLIESHLPGVFSLLIILPAGVLVFAFAWRHLPEQLRALVPEGWEAALLIPVVLLLGWFSMAVSAPLEHLLFEGDMRRWLASIGFSYDQRNSLVVGLAMGFAVIPTIFSIAEDAIFSVPKHLSFGSLALGATPWQTLMRVVLLTASPGIFSALMIGIGRAVGETMIVLMATGNTPVMDFSIFQGMRTLSANIAVEMSESEVASTHYRVLFLAALVLFFFTFIFNTVAELIRHRLRRKYSSL